MVIILYCITIFTVKLIKCSHSFKKAFQYFDWWYIYYIMMYSVMICLLLQYVFDYTPGDVFGCVADIGWITGHSYVVYGPLCNGATSVLFESTPVYPNPGEYQEK